MSEFAKGVKVRGQQTQYGEIIKLGINKDEFLQNPFNERGWVNIDILTSKNGNKYAKINDYKRETTTKETSVVEETNEDYEPIADDLDVEEIPF